jgi:hypothetical protein
MTPSRVVAAGLRFSGTCRLQCVLVIFVWLIASCAVAYAESGRNPGYSCADQLDAAAQVVCGDDSLSTASLELSQAYYGLRGAVDRAFWPAYKQQAVEFLKVELRRCGIPGKGPVSSERLPETKNCLLGEMNQQRNYWIGELGRIGSFAGLEEVLRDTVANVQLQWALKDGGWLDSNGEVDGVFGEATRQAIRNAQTSFGLFPDGLMSNNIASHLTKAESTQSGSVRTVNKRPLPSCPRELTAYWTNCFGTLTWPNGDKYAGEFRDDKRTGQGTFTWPDGQKYVGEFRDSKRTGQGTYKWLDGTQYAGEWRDNKRTGQGTYTWGAGTNWAGQKYVGEFRDDKFNGQAVLFAVDGSVVRNGIWVDDNFFQANNLLPRAAQPSASTRGSEVGLVKENGTFKVPVLINGIIPLHFTVDSGAADVSIPSDVVSTLVRLGTILPTDFLGTQTYILADGSRVPSPTFRISSLKVGDRVIENILGSVADAKGGLLLGQSFLSRFKLVSFDYQRQVLVLE